MTSSVPRSSRAAKEVDGSRIPAARRRGGGGGESHEQGFAKTYSRERRRSRGGGKRRLGLGGGASTPSLYIEGRGTTAALGAPALGAPPYPFSKKGRGCWAPCPLAHDGPANVAHGWPQIGAANKLNKNNFIFHILYLLILLINKHNIFSPGTIALPPEPFRYSSKPFRCLSDHSPISRIYPKLHRTLSVSPYGSRIM